MALPHFINDQKQNVGPTEFAEWLDSNTPTLLMQPNIRVTRCHSEIKDIEELLFFDSWENEIPRRYGMIMNTLLTKTADGNYYISSLQNCDKLSALNIFSERVSVFNLTENATKLAIKIYAAVISQSFSGPTKLIEGGFLGTPTFPDNTYTSALNRKPYESDKLATFLQNPYLFSAWMSNAINDPLAILSYYSHCDSSFLKGKISELELISYMEEGSPKFITQYANRIIQDAVSRDKNNPLFDENIASIIELNFVFSYLSRYFPTLESQKSITTCGESIRKTLHDHNASIFYVFFPESDTPISECTDNDLVKIKFSKNAIPFPQDALKNVGLNLGNTGNAARLSRSECLNHPLIVTERGLLPWSKIHHIVHLKKTIWTNPEITTQEP